MKPLYEDLWISTPEFPAAETEPELMMHGFMLKHPRGNLLIARVEHPEDHQALADLGGVMRHYLTHWHEAAPGALAIQQRFNSALYCHTRALGPVSLVLEPDATLNTMESHFGDFHILPSPGHTPGCCSFFYHSPYGRSYLFVGDTLTQDKGRWITVTVADSNAADLQQTLAHYRTLQPDVVLMSTTRGHLSWQEVTREQWQDAINQAEQSPLDMRDAPHY
ncbi:glyoxylase-like metal-dependent hydrolase (beta-lactamase superfamily II) [Erwinia toletana]|uniref:Glyoxylase-like metal-dependent hydrolase (Beta-lactamase superfamily II) n=1 Tax=Winslowiella toletana TaxID=92490 RepID=A0ABS4PEJ3_9GAMM|nr:MBL fold metallo-hydrolase [Winslowiella toletana]MBP2171046.1 glyoxylase-like metal-dependent hydrolase (beta-lactamase superfamily II) [Winslowiella toletana]